VVHMNRCQCYRCTDRYPEPGELSCREYADFLEAELERLVWESTLPTKLRQPHGPPGTFEAFVVEIVAGGGW